MEAMHRTGIHLWVVFAVLFGFAESTAHAANARSQNFIVSAPTKALAEEIAIAAENYRRDLAIHWLGAELPKWTDPCPIVAQVAPNLGAGGVTSFIFQDPVRPSEPRGWQMEIQGSRERILDSVLPHEVSHTVFATHFGRPLPRWADEGACTTVEHASERDKQDQFLIRFLTSNRGIPFNRMFAMKKYPPDIMPLYSQGYSLARYLIAQGGPKKFVAFLGDGMASNQWNEATQKHYGFQNLSELQVTWLAWVREAINIPGSDDARDQLARDSRSQSSREQQDSVARSDRARGLASTEVDDRSPERLGSRSKRSGAVRRFEPAQDCNRESDIEIAQAGPDGNRDATPRSRRKQKNVKLASDRLTWYGAQKDRRASISSSPGEIEEPSNETLSNDLEAEDSRATGRYRSVTRPVVINEGRPSGSKKNRPLEPIEWAGVEKNSTRR